MMPNLTTKFNSGDHRNLEQATCNLIPNHHGAVELEFREKNESLSSVCSGKLNNNFYNILSEVELIRNVCFKGTKVGEKSEMQMEGYLQFRLDIK